jgi:hypothetical protein
MRQCFTVHALTKESGELLQCKSISKRLKKKKKKQDFETKRCLFVEKKKKKERVEANSRLIYLFFIYSLLSSLNKISKQKLSLISPQNLTDSLFSFNLFTPLSLKNPMKH